MAPEQIAATFRHARLDARALTGYPGGSVPTSLAEAYAIQDLAIAAWPDQLVGWKVAALAPAWRDRFPAERLAGPVFSRALVTAGADVVHTPMIHGAYAAVEAEFAVLLAADFPLHTRFAEAAQLIPYIAAVHGAIEMAGSPLPALSALGPGALISDFGNNTGLIIGPRLPDFLARDAAQWTCATEINGVLAGQGSAARIPDGPLAALLFLANLLVERGATLRPGDWVSTGASTGIHPVQIGDTATVRFAGQPALAVRIVAALPGVAVHGGITQP